MRGSNMNQLKTEKYVECRMCGKKTFNQLNLTCENCGWVDEE